MKKLPLVKISLACLSFSLIQNVTAQTPGVTGEIDGAVINNGFVFGGAPTDIEVAVGAVTEDTSSFRYNEVSGVIGALGLGVGDDLLTIDAAVVNSVFATSATGVCAKVLVGSVGHTGCGNGD